MLNKDPNQMLETLTDEVYQLCTAHVPPKVHKTKGGNNTIPRVRKILMRKRTKLSKKLKIMQHSCSPNAISTHNEEIEVKLKSSHEAQR